MKEYTEIEIKGLIEQFEDCSLAKSEWTHASHLIVALWYLSKHTTEDATRCIREGIQRLNAAHGVIATPYGGYHETLTLFWIKQVSGFIQKDPTHALLTDKANDLIRYLSDSKLPLQYYSRERLFSPEARSDWIEPDGVPFND